ncbi:MAG TPA: filamentous hemagglutinin N-terminal domain-containing protein [Trichormus sp. M33_DOE_039]|nr:filamentous hemagglutinin N-terminal domain-containing protein [Trichormus sp. M33_DOE_039]
MLLHHLLKQSKQCRHCFTAVIAVAVTTGVMLEISNYAQANIVEDKTLPNNSQVTLSRDTFLIEGGTQIGNNLFHSFSEFSLPQNYAAYFNNQPHIQNIFSRVTGTQPSYINGLIRTNPGANLFIINPNGISFGSKATLRIGGSFFASTASSINFDNGEKFSAKPEETTSLLTVKTPIGLQFGIKPQKPETESEPFQIPIGVEFSSNPQPIHVQGGSALNFATLQVADDQSLALVGGNLVLENANISSSNSGGRLELASLASPGVVGLTTTKSGIFLKFDAAPDLGNIRILSGTNIHNWSDLQITGKNIDINSGYLTTVNEFAVNVSENIQLFNNSAIYVGSSGKLPGNLTINTQNLLIQSGSYIGIDKGNLTINASDTVRLNSNPDSTVENSSRLFATASEDITETAGNLTINTQHLLVQNGSQILTNSSGSAVPSLLSFSKPMETAERNNLTVNASESVTLSGSSLNELNPSGLFNRTFEDGDSGTLTINTKVLSITDGAQVITSNLSPGKTGNLTINATEKVEIIGTSPTGKIVNDAQNDFVVDEPVPDVSLISFSSVRGLKIQDTLPSGLFTNAPGIGDAGDIHINTQTLIAQNGGQISANTFNHGRSGNLTVNATEQVQLLGTSANGISSGLFTRSNTRATGEAGNLNILTGNLLVQDGAQVSASTFSAGKGGNLNVQATEGIKLIGVSPQNVASGLFTQANPGSIADAGELIINTSSLLVRDGAQVSASTFGTGKGGHLTVKATEGIELIGTSGNGDLFPSGLFAVTAGNATGDAGNLLVDSPQLLVRDGAQIAASTSSQGKGGNLTVNVSDRVQLVGTGVNGAFASGLFATATPDSTGDAGNLIANTDILKVWQGAGIAVRNRGRGSAGNLFVNARFIDLDDQAFISADTRGVNQNSNQPQANITLRSQDLLLLRGNSSITTNAIGKNVIGGNINIDTKLLAAFENSDITANSADFQGGRVRISAQGITGTQFRNALTPESDITATGATPELSGTVEITTAEVDPSRGLTELPSNLTDVSNQIVQKCRAGEAVARQPNQFLITGKGGIPANPYDTLQNESAIANWINVNNINNVAQNPTNYTKISASPETTIVEAKALISDGNGNIVLTAAAPNLNFLNSLIRHPVCNS